MLKIITFSYYIYSIDIVFEYFNKDFILQLISMFINNLALKFSIFEYLNPKVFVYIEIN